MRRVRAGLALAALAHLTCADAPLTPGPGVTLSVFANPPFIVANGGVSVISALVIEPAGTLVPDGTVVLFFSTLGRIEPQGQTKDGVARVNLVADSRSGTAQVTAVAGDQTATVEGGVVIGSANPETVLVSANPARITQPREAAITANVFDVNGNPISGIPVIFSVSATPLEETLDSGGAPRFTDTNGQAFDTLRTRRPVASAQKIVTVTATTPNAKSGDTTVAVN